MKKVTPQKLSKRLAKYGALSIAIAGVADASGQIIYTDVNPDQNIIGGDYLLDMDNDGTDEFLLRQGSNYSSYYSRTNYYNRVAPSFSSGGILGIDSGFDYPFALSSGATISSAQTSWLPGNGFFKTMNYNSCNYTSSQWCGVTDRFLGLRFAIGANIHYGWARLDGALSPSTGGFTIKDYAYNSTPDEAITAGQTVLGLDDNELSKIKIVALNKSIALFNLPQQTNYRLFSLTGQSVLDGKISNNTHVIEASTLATGVYIIELEDAKINAVIRKKIVL